MSASLIVSSALSLSAMLGALLLGDWIAVGVFGVLGLVLYGVAE